MFVYVISFRRHTKKINLESKDREAILAVVKEKFNFQGSLENLWVQYKDDDFGMFIDVDDFNNLPDKGVLQILEEETVPVKRKIPRLEEPSQKSNGSKNGRQSIGRQSIGKKSFKQYELPEFPESVQNALETDPKSILKEAKLKNLLVQTMAKDLHTYTENPQAQQLKTVVARLVQQYPELSDKTQWTEKMRIAFNFVQRRNSDTSDVLAKRTKLNTSKNRKSVSSTPGSEAIRCERRQMVDRPPAENPHAITMYRANITRELSKTEPDYDIIDDCMDRTKGDRFAKYSEAVQVVLNDYPVLRDLVQLQKDCCRMLGVNAAENRKKFLSKSCITALKSRLEAYPAAKPFLEKAVDEESGLQSVLVTLPLLFRESISNWIVTNENDFTAHPVLQISTDDNPLKPIVVDVCVNGKVVSSSAQISIATGLDALMAAIYLWNFEYNPSCRKTFRFYSEVVCGFPSGKALPPSVQSLVNALSNTEP